MNTLDIILLACVGIGALLGLKFGIVKQLSFGASIAVGLLQASIFYKRTGAWLQGLTEWNELACNILGYVIVFIIAAAVVNLIGVILRSLLQAVLLGWLDRTLGALFTATIGMGIVVLLVNISQSILPDNEITGKTSQEESVLYNSCAKVTFLVIEEAKKIDEEKEQHTEEAGEQSL
jgi:membrane protein required for colicin V production